MKTRFGRSVLLVEDYDEAFDFYHKNFFCEKIFDETLTDGQRYLHIRFSDDSDTGIWFLKAGSESQEKLIGKQTGGQPALVIYTNDCSKLYQHVKNNQVEIIDPIKFTKGSIFFRCEDLYGNRITVVELTSSL